MDDTKSDSNYDTIHYLSPASLTLTTLAGEDDHRFGSASSAAFLRYLHAQACGFTGETISQSSLRSSEKVKYIELERTLAIIKPDAVEFEDVIVHKMKVSGFRILQKRKIHLTPEQASEVYAHRYGQISFPYTVISMSSGPIIVICIAGRDAVRKWLRIVRGNGTLHETWFYPRCIRLKFGIMETMENILHASEDLRSANREIRYFFPKMILEPLLVQECEINEYLDLHVNPTMLDGLTELCKRKPVEPILYFADWLLLNNPYQPKMAPEIAKLPT